jgi:hypothetical protein
MTPTPELPTKSKPTTAIGSLREISPPTQELEGFADLTGKKYGRWIKQTP